MVIGLNDANAADAVFQLGSIVNSGAVTVRQIDAPVQPIVIYRKFRIQHTNNRQNNLLSLLNINNWVNATRTTI